MHQHVEDNIIVLNKFTPPYPTRCGQCDMFVPQDTLAAGNLCTKMCRMGVDKKRHSLAANYTQLSTRVEFRDQEQVLNKVDTSKYLGSMLSFDDSYLTSMSRNFQREWIKWGQLLHLLGK